MNEGSKRTTLKATPAMQAAARKQPPPVAISPKLPLEIGRSTRVGEVYWCAFSPHNWTPEFDDTHLVVIIRGGRKDRGAHMVVPLTKQPQNENPHGYRLTRNPNPGSAPEAWAVCDHVYTVASERLKLLRDHNGKTKTPEKIDDDDLREIGRRVFKALNTFASATFPQAAQATSQEDSHAPAMRRPGDTA